MPPEGFALPRWRCSGRIRYWRTPRTTWRSLPQRQRPSAAGEGGRVKMYMNRALLIDPDNFSMRYNFACGLCVYQHDKNAALEMLEPVFARITADLLRYMQADPDFESLHDDPRYKPWSPLPRRGSQRQKARSSRRTKLPESKPATLRPSAAFACEASLAAFTSPARTTATGPWWSSAGTAASSRGRRRRCCARDSAVPRIFRGFRHPVPRRGRSRAPAAGLWRATPVRYTRAG